MIQARPLKLPTEMIEEKATEKDEKKAHGKKDAAMIVATSTEELDSLSECIQIFQRSNMSMREALILAALLRLLLKIPDEETKRIADRVLFYLEFLKSLSLDERRLEVHEIPDPESHDALLDRFYQAASAILRSLE